MLRSGSSPLVDCRRLRARASGGHTAMSQPQTPPPRPLILSSTARSHIAPGNARDSEPVLERGVVSPHRRPDPPKRGSSGPPAVGILAVALALLVLASLGLQLFRGEPPPPSATATALAVASTEAVIQTGAPSVGPTGSVGPTPTLFPPIPSPTPSPTAVAPTPGPTPTAT